MFQTIPPKYPSCILHTVWPYCEIRSSGDAAKLALLMEIKRTRQAKKRHPVRFCFASHTVRKGLCIAELRALWSSPASGNAPSVVEVAALGGLHLTRAEPAESTRDSVCAAELAVRRNPSLCEISFPSRVGPWPSDKALDPHRASVSRCGPPVLRWKGTIRSGWYWSGFVATNNLPRVGGDYSDYYTAAVRWERCSDLGGTLT